MRKLEFEVSMSKGFGMEGGDITVEVSVTKAEEAMLRRCADEESDDYCEYLEDMPGAEVLLNKIAKAVTKASREEDPDFDIEEWSMSVANPFPEADENTEPTYDPYNPFIDPDLWKR